MADDAESSSRSNLASATYTAIALVFFFGVGLAGGAAYKIYFGDDAGPQVADRVSPPPSPTAPSPPSPYVAAENPAPDLARIEPSVPPALAPPPPPTVPKKPGLPPAAVIAQAAPPPTIPALAQAAPTPAPQVASTKREPTPVPYAEVAPLKPDAQPKTQTVQPRHIAAIPPKKPTVVAKPYRPPPTKIMGPPQIAALHAPPTAPGNVAGPFRVQFGAFANEDNARRVQWAIEASGLKVDVSQEPGPSGHPLYFLRSPSYPDYAAALSAAQTVQNRVQHFINAIPIEYRIRSDHSAFEQQAQR